MKDLARWQFWSRTHPPLVRISSKTFIAFPSCPLPRETVSNLFLSYPWSSANFFISLIGSLPGDKMNINGTILELCLYDLANSNGGGSMNSLPIFFSIHSWIAAISLSGLTILIRHSFINSLVFSSHWSGIGSVWGEGLS